MIRKLINNDINRILAPIKINQKNTQKTPQEIKKQKNNVKELEESSNEKLKNYITPIISYADLLIQEVLGKLLEPQKEKIEFIKEQAIKITNYLDAIKSEGVLQLESAKLPDQVQELEFNPLRRMLQEMITQTTLNIKTPTEYDIGLLPKEIIKIQKKSKNILVIYMNDDLCKMFGACLKKDGYDCTCVVDGRNGLFLITLQEKLSK